MKKEWQTPTIEILDINQTMYGNGGPYHDTVSFRGALVDENDDALYSGQFEIIQV